MSEQSISGQIAETLRSKGFVPVPVQVLSADTSAVRYFVGDLDGFLEAAQALGSKAVFVETLHLEDDEFYYDAGSDDDFDEDEEEECSCEDCDCDCEEEEEEGTEVELEDVAEEVAEGEEEVDEDAIFLSPEDLDGMDLSLLNPELAEYLEKVGEECGVRLTLPGPDHLEVEIFTDWYEKFMVLADEASDEIEIDPAEALKKFKANI